MWFLSNQDSTKSDKIYYVKHNRANIVGRTIGDLVFPEDLFISRKHATLYVERNEFYVLDHNSKSGTFLNEGILKGNKIEPNIKVPLKVNDIVRFGPLGCKWTIVRQDFITCLSTIKEEDIVDIKSNLNTLGVTVSKNWSSNCTHVTMPSITLTFKVLLALVYQKPIVKPDFWTDCLNSFENNLALPNPIDYLPVVNEPTINAEGNFKANPKRCTLFSGKLLIFLSPKKLNNYEQIIQGAGGQCCLLDHNLANKDLCSSRSIVIQHRPRSTQDTQSSITNLENILKYMTSNKCRIIPESEIGLAILYVSIEKYCNSSFSFASAITKDNTFRPSNGNIAQMLAAETQEVVMPSTSFFSSSRTSTTKIDETCSLSEKSDGNQNTRNISLKFPTKGVLKNKLSLSSTGQPQAKKKHTEETDDTYCEENLFSDQETSNKSSNMTKTTEKSEVVLQISKRKRRRGSSDTEELFEFVPDNPSTKRKKEGSPKNGGPSIAPAKVLNIVTVTKRKIDDSFDSPDSKRMLLKSTSFSGSAFPTPKITHTDVSTKIDFENRNWLCKNKIGSDVLVKQEISDKEFGSISHEVGEMLKLKDLDIRPAIVIINNNLIIKKEVGDILIVNDSATGRKNFKIFKKVQPRAKKAELIKSYKLVDYESKSKSSVACKFTDFSSDDDYDYGYKTTGRNP